MSIAGAAIAGGVALASGIYSGVSAGKMNKRGERFQREENEKARAYNDRLISDAQAYNDPKRQMERLKAAGINPHMAYANGAPMNVQQQTPTASTSSTAPNYKMADMSSATQGLMNVAMMKSQIDNLNADTEKKRAEARNTTTNTDISAVELENKVNQVNQENMIRDVQINGGVAQKDLTLEQVRKTNQEVANLVSTNEQIRAYIDKLVAERNLTEQQKTNLIAQLSVIYATKKNIDADTNVKGTQATLNKEKSQTEAVSRSNIRVDTLSKNEQLKMYERNNRIGDKYDYSNAESDMKLRDANTKKAIKLVTTADKSNQMLDLKLTEQEYNNTIRMFETVDAGFNTFNPFNKFKTGNTTSTTTRFDNRGDYSGHSTTRSRTR